MKISEQENLELYILIFSSIILFSCLAGFIVYFLVLYKNRQLRNQQEKAALQSKFKQEILTARIEIQEDTQAHISREIHDNITQVLSFVKLNLAMLNAASDAQKNERITESRELIAQVITDLRDLSKSLSFEHIINQGLVKSLEAEVVRLNKSGMLSTTLSVLGNAYPLGEQRELVLFRIFQEALNNTLKHSGADSFKIGLEYKPDLFILTLCDNGKGFSIQPADNLKGSGLRNIENRAALVGAKAVISSTPGMGCEIKISLNPLDFDIYNDPTNSDRPGG